MQRPNSIYTPHEGLLRCEQFQISYATNDIERAKAFMQQQLGINRFRELSGPLPTGGHIHVELAWVGNTMYELITAEGEGSDLYVGGLSKDQFSIRHHHLGFLVHSEEEWNALQREIDDKQWPMPYINHTPGFMRSCFVECAILGHYFEYLWPEPAALEFFCQQVPAN